MVSGRDLRMDDDHSTFVVSPVEQTWVVVTFICVFFPTLYCCRLEAIC
jgi:hypothetical protein